MFVTKNQSYKDNFFKACINLEFFPWIIEIYSWVFWSLSFFQNVEKKAGLTACWMLLYHSKKRIIDSIWLEEQHETKHTCEVRFRSKNTLTEMAGISIRSWYTVGFWIDPDKLKPSYLKTRKPLDQKTRKT